jgi:hypothetical protein
VSPVNLFITVHDDDVEVPNFHKSTGETFPMGRRFFAVFSEGTRSLITIFGFFVLIPLNDLQGGNHTRNKL